MLRVWPQLLVEVSHLNTGGNGLLDQTKQGGREDGSYNDALVFMGRDGIAQLGVLSSRAIAGVEHS